MPAALVVDDNADIRLLLRCALEPAGFTVTEADGGPTALSTLAAGQVPDVVVLDVQMPEMDGWETLRVIRADPATAALPVLICTVKGRPADLERGRELGCDGYLTKPFDVRSVVAQIRATIAAGADRDAPVPGGAGGNDAPQLKRKESTWRSEH